MCSPSAEFPSSFKDCSWSPPTPTTRLPPTRSEYKGRINGDHPRYPRVVVRDSLGNKLDTFTYLQEAIYRAEWNVKNSHEAVLPEEWRLPKAPNPARPDYSRTAPVLASVRGRLRSRWDRTQDVSRSVPNARLHEIDVGDVAFVAESLNQLPRVPSLSFLHHDLLAEPKRYFQIVNQAMVQRRYFAQTDKRERVYNFPGFCTGCRRSGLCYGCERSSEPHYHVDRIMKTGGGFTYHRHDRPIREQMGKNPSNWKLAFPELALKHLIKEHKNGSVSLSEDEELACKPDIAGRHNESFNQKASNDTGYPNTDDQEMEEESVGTQEEIVKQWALMREEQLTGDNKRGIVQDKNQNQSRISQENMDAMSPWKDTSLGNKEVIDESLYRGESHLSTGSQDITIPRHTQETDDSKDNASSQESQQLHDPVQDQDLDHTVEQEDHSDTSDKTEQLLENPVDVQNQTDNDADSEGEEEDEHMRDTYNSSSKARDMSHTSKLTDISGSQKTGTYTPGTKSQSRGDTSSDKTGRQENRSEESGSSPYSPYSNKRRQPLYKAPPPFKVKHRKNRLTESRSPFSSDRKYDLPTGSGFQVKKSEKKLTEFKEFKHHEGEWKEPEKFTVKKAEKATTEFWSAPKKKEAKKKPRVKKEEKRPVSPDSGLESEKPTDSAQELPLKTPAIIEAERVLSPPLQRISSPEPPRKERPKKTKKEAPPRKPPSPIRSLTPKSPEPVFEEEAVTLKSREPTPEHVPTPTPKVLELPPVDIPPLPDIVMEEKKEKKPKVSNRKLVEPIQVMPKVKDALPPPPKKSKPPPIMKKSTYKKRIPSAEAPVTTEEIRQMKDPLDFLAKYCIISKDRLPYYERIYKNVVSSQPERYEREHPLSPTTGMPVTEGTSWGKHELNMFHDLITISRGQEPKRPGLSGPEQYLEKICYTLEMLDSKHQQLAGDLHLLETKRVQQLAESARKLVPDITSIHYQKKEKKSKKKKKKKKNKVEVEEPPAKVITSRADITDDVIVSRIDEKLLKKLMKEPAQHQLNCEIERCTEKLANIEDRLIQLEGEKNIIGMYCMELFFEAQNDNNKPPEFRRQQSFLYKTLHPDPDEEMNREELEGALQIVNHNLLTENEFSYMYHILNLTGRRKINFKLFCVIAALSERITHMDPVIRELLNKEKGWKRETNDYETLDVRMNRSKELFQLLDEGDSVPFGNALASSLAVELTAGGLSPELTNYVMSKFNREGKGYVDFLDYVTYVPLFIEIHEKIIKDPLCSTVRIS